MSNIKLQLSSLGAQLTKKEHQQQITDTFGVEIPGVPSKITRQLRTRARIVEPVFIVAQYKCGTSWLLSALSAHPLVLGIREIDIVRAAIGNKGKSSARTDNEDRLTRFFGKSSWCPMDVIESLAKGEPPTPKASDTARPQSFFDLAPDVAMDLYRQIRDAKDETSSMDAFLAGVGTRHDEPVLVLKAADQIAVFDALQSWRPDCKKIAITRDGRDASISALHFRKQMRNAPWFGGETDYWSLLKNWANRANMIVDRAQAGELYLIRYEDMTSDFTGCLAALLGWLGLENSAKTIIKINEQTCFEAKTGRARGTEGSGIIRKGAVGEWKETLGERERKKAWSLAGVQLSRLGYTKDGARQPLPEACRVLA